MSIQSEEILIKEFTSGTTMVFFSTHLGLEEDGVAVVPFDIVPTIVELNSFNQPTRVSTFDGVNIWSMNGANNYVPISSLSTNYMTGYSYVRDVAQIVNEPVVEQNFYDYMTGVTFNYETPLTEPTISCVFFSYHEIDDFFVNVKLNRTFGTLDTLNIYNNLTKSMPTQEADTGVVFGRLVASQNIKDAEGNNVLIPLRNVPVGIFNASEDYPISSSVSNNGDRLFLNINETASEEEYFNVESFDLDKKMLRSASQFTTVPDQYKFVTTTNDEGEFVIYNAPLGNQIAIFEVDLLKQGLTKDEVALNFFPYPPDEDAILGQIPTYSFKQFPISVVPSWGTIQTGYTELNVTINMDLRKWTTYILPPVAVAPEKLEASVAKSASNSVKIEARDMSKEGYPRTNVKFVEIPNDLDKVSNQQYNWHLEFAQLKDKAEYYKFGCNVIKLPANIYDPEGFKTDKDGIPTTHKGVWLSAYQLNLYSNQTVSRKTGAIYAWNGSDVYTKSHFDVTYSTSVPDEPGLAEMAGLGTFPYERPWTADYPNKYSIPKKPTDERYRYGPARTPSSNPAIFYLDEPAYNDGDLIGYEVDDFAGGLFAGGYGSQSFAGTWVHNRIAEVATKNFMYKYEKGVAWNDSYANGYEPSNPGYVRFAGVSEVVGGEKYQRFEAGYGYFLRPSGWPRVGRTLWGSDTYFGPDLSVNNGLVDSGNPNHPGPGVTGSVVLGGLWGSESHINDVYNIDNFNVSAALNSKAKIKRGTLEAYRIVDSNPDNLSEQGGFVIPTTTQINWGYQSDDYWDDNGANSTLHPGGQGTAGVTIVNTGEVPAAVNFVLGNGQNYTETLQVGGSWYVYWDLLGQFQVPVKDAPCIWKLAGNADFDTNTNKYTKAKYKLLIGRLDASPSATVWQTPFNTGTPQSPVHYDFVSSVGGGVDGGRCWGAHPCDDTHHWSDNDGGGNPGDGDELVGDLSYVTFVQQP